MFAALSQHIKAVEDNLASYVALGPVAFLTNMQSDILKKLQKPHLTEILLKSGVKSLLYSNNQQIFNLVSNACQVDRATCRDGLFVISEKNNSVNNVDRMPVVLGHYPSGSSTKNFDHFSQSANKGIFSKYDYGAKGNMKVYGSKEPPVYEVKNITFPVHLMAGYYDRLADMKDVELLYERLKCEKVHVS